MHGDPIISGMAETEKPDKRPKCDWPITEKHADGGTSTRRCDSEEGILIFKGAGKYTGRPRETPVCREHWGRAYEKWNVDRADPICG